MVVGVWLCGVHMRASDLDAASRRRVILANGELDLLPALSQALQLLHQALAIGCVAHDDAAIVVLNCACVRERGRGVRERE